MTIRQGCIHNNRLQKQLLRENATNDPQGLSSLFGNFLEGGGGGAGAQQQQGGIGNLVGGLLGGGSGDNQDPRQQQQEQKGGLGDMLGL